MSYLGSDDAIVPLRLRPGYPACFAPVDHLETACRQVEICLRVTCTATFIYLHSLAGYFRSLAAYLHLLAGYLQIAVGQPVHHLHFTCASDALHLRIACTPPAYRLRIIVDQPASNRMTGALLEGAGRFRVYRPSSKLAYGESIGITIAGFPFSVVR
jgi:hypothetical protein